MIVRPGRSHRLVLAVLPIVVSSALGLPATMAATAAARPPDPPVPAYHAVEGCVRDKAEPDTVANGVGWAQRALQFTDAWRFNRGHGVKVAVIDTGVNPGPAFGARLTGIGDLVQRNDPNGPDPGLDDCDGHGTLVAGIIGASPDAKSGFTGVAPDATILSLRQSSDVVRVKNSNGDSQPSGTRQSLAAAIEDATDAGAKVINISEADCGPAGSVRNSELTDAVADAVRRDVVVVVAAGNVEDGGTCKPQNVPGHRPVTAATPADLDGVLAVAAVGPDGAPAPFSLVGSWVGVAAPGTEIVSTNPYPEASGQVNEVTTQNGSGTIQGTSFAAPYVAGVAALVRAQFPQLKAPQVIDRIERTAAHPAAPGGRNDYVGFGMVNPIAALSAVLPDASGVPSAPPRAAALPPKRVHAAVTRPRRVALIGSLVVGAAVVVVLVAVPTARSRRRRVG